MLPRDAPKGLHCSPILATALAFAKVWIIIFMHALGWKLCQLPYPLPWPNCPGLLQLPPEPIASWQPCRRLGCTNAALLAARMQSPRAPRPAQDHATSSLGHASPPANKHNMMVNKETKEHPKGNQANSWAKSGNEVFNKVAQKPWATGLALPPIGETKAQCSLARSLGRSRSLYFSLFLPLPAPSLQR